MRELRRVEKDANMQDATMKRKDCDDTNRFVKPFRGTPRSGRPMRWATSIALVIGAFPLPLLAGSVRLWPSAVVVDDTIHLSDLCELDGFSPTQESGLRKVVITNAPTPSGSRVIHLDMVRSALTAHGTNLATITFNGTTECQVTRPANASSESADSGPSNPSLTRRQNGDAPNGTADGERAIQATENLTLRHEVIEQFDREFARYGGKSDVAFDRTSAQILDLSKPAYTFRVRRRGGRPLGLVQLEVDVLAENRIVQTVPLVAQVSMVRPVVLARRSINQGATIRASDVELKPISFMQLDRLGVDDTSVAVGQRAKRFISAGTQIELAMLEQIPLVTRGQFVTLTSVAGFVRIVTTAKALHDGLYGETITVRSSDKKRTEFEAVVVGPSAVRIGVVRSQGPQKQLAMGNGS